VIPWTIFSKRSARRRSAARYTAARYSKRRHGWCGAPGGASTPDPGAVPYLDSQADALWELGLHQAALGAWWQARTLAQALDRPLAARLDNTFAQREQELGQDAYQALMAELPTQAEVWRQEAIEALRQAHGEAQTA
jgi:hypothetical protein